MLDDLLAEFVGALVPGPSTDRGLVLLFIVLGVAAASIQLGLRLTIGDPMKADSWIWSLFLGALLVALAGVVFGLLAAVRGKPYRLLAFACLFTIWRLFWGPS